MKWVKIILRNVLMGALLLLTAALFYILVIMGDMPELDNEVPSQPTELSSQPLETPKFAAHLPIDLL